MLGLYLVTLDPDASQLPFLFHTQEDTCFLWLLSVLTQLIGAVGVGLDHVYYAR